LGGAGARGAHGYNQVVRILPLLLAAYLASGCSRPPQNKEAVREAVVQHLASRSGLDVSSMEVEVASVSFRGNEAEALVSFRAKGSTDPSAAMQMRYALESKGRKWLVKGRSEAGGTPHGGQGQGGALPPGHPPVENPPPSKPK
jgi:hypothetical protein